jgi:hypothetical protein
MSPVCRQHQQGHSDRPRPEAHDITGLNAVRRITGMASVPYVDVLGIASEPDTGHDVQGIGTQLDSESV